MIRRTLAAAVLLAVAGALLIAAWPGLFGLQHSPVIAQVVSLRALAVVCAALVVVVLLLIAFLAPAARRFAASLALVFTLFALLSGAVLADRGLGNDTAGDPGPADITVLAWNTLGDAPSIDDMSDLIVETQADIVALPETTSETALALALQLRAEGRPMWVLTSAYDEISKARSTSLLVSAELGEYRIRPDAAPTVLLPTLVAEPVSGTGPVIAAVHAVAPLPEWLPEWKNDLRIIADLCIDDNVILAGDFNATLDHFSGIRGDAPTLGGCEDAALATGNAAVGTWPTALPALLGAPIDHIMATDHWRATAFTVITTHDDAGSDHRPIVATLQPVGRQ